VTEIVPVASGANSRGHSIFRLYAWDALDFSNFPTPGAPSVTGQLSIFSGLGVPESNLGLGIVARPSVKVLVAWPS
jgi:hypothetical protein